MHATFFLLGAKVRSDWALASEIVAAGHEVAVHGDEHRPLLLRTPGATYDDLRRGRDTLAELAGRPPLWWRPTYGVPSAAALAVARSLSLRPVLWTAWGRDWADGEASSVADRVLRGVTGGGTVLLHDVDGTPCAAALPEVVAGVRARGLALGPLAEHGL